MLAGFIFLFAPSGLTGKLQLAYARLFRWPLSRGRGITVAARSTRMDEQVNAVSYRRLVAEHRKLKNDYDNLRAELREAERQRDEATALKQSLGWPEMRLHLAHVITGHGPTDGGLIIGRGPKDRVAVGQFVISLADRAVIGQISHVFAETAKVKLITDPTSKLQVSLGEHQVRAVMEGRGGGIAKIPWVAAAKPVATDYAVYVSTVPGQLDVPIIAGRVTKCERDTEDPLFLDITVQPVWDPATLTEVAVIVPPEMPS
jgi:cell shape-determining protein MreC